MNKPVKEKPAKRPASRPAQRGKAKARHKEPVRVARRRKQKKPSPFQLAAIGRLDKSAVILLIFLFCLTHWVVRVLLNGAFTVEESEQILLSQSFQVGYQAAKPPLLAWLFTLAARGPGISEPVIFGLKYALMFAGLTLYYLAARNVLVKPGVSAAAVASWALSYYLGWGVHEDLLGVVALMAAMALSLHAMTRILTWRRPRDWVYLGFGMAAGILTSHLYAVFIVPLILAAALSPFFRGAIRLPNLMIAVGIAVVAYAPYLFWLATHSDAVARAVQAYSVSWELEPEWLIRAREGAFSLGLGLLEFTLPMVLFWFFLFWSLWLPIIYPMFARRSTDEEPHETAWRKLFASTIAIGMGLFAIAVLVGAQTFKGYWLAPALFTLPIWMFAHVKRAGEFPVAIRAYAAVAILLMAGVLAGRIVEWNMEIDMCDEGGCRPYTPAEDWSEALVQSGFQGGTIVGADAHLTGNLMAHLPRARAMDASLTPSAFPRSKTRGACLAVWRNTNYMPKELSDYLVIELKTPPRGGEPEGAIRRNFRSSQSKASTLYFQFVPPSETCR